MSEDFFDSILPPVKTNMEPPKDAEISQSMSVGKPSGTDIDKLWEEIYTSDDTFHHANMNNTSIIHSNSPIISNNVQLSNLQQNIQNANIIALNKSIMQQSQNMNMNMNNGKVLILAGKRKSQYINEPPSKEMRITPGNESRRIFQAALQNRNLNPMPPQPIMTIENHGEEEAEEEPEAHTEVYSQYQPLKLRKGKVHPYPVVESSSLSSVEVPNVRYCLSLPEGIIQNALLSNVQLEAVIYGCQRHEEILPTGERAGYLIGDGAGVGKGRTLAAIIYENYILHRKRAVWISVSNDLKHDAERDLCDLDAGHIKIHPLNKMRYAKINSPENGNVRKGVLFSTYASLIGECQNMTKSKYKTRFRQIVQWFGNDYDGVIVFDECHKAKNLMPQGSQKKTKTAEIVLKLQETLPKARIVYASATGASEPRNMAYMTRLGLWGPGTPFKKFEDFVEKLEDKVGAMELVAVDMKQRGMYIARQLSFANVTFRVHEVQLTNVKIGDHYFMDVYNESVDLWTRIFDNMNQALSTRLIDKKHAKTIWGQYWAAHQRFFKYLCMAGKVQECVRITMDAITQHKCVVIGLQSTGEAKTNEMLEDYGGEVTEFVSCARGILQSFVERFFPTEENINQMDKREDKTKSNPNTKANRKKGNSKKPISLQDALGKDFLEKVTEEGASSDASSRFSDSEDSDASLSEKSVKKKKVKSKDEDTDLDDEDVEILMEDFSRSYENNSMKTGADVSCRITQRELLDSIERLAPKLPINTLDDLIRELGGPDYVAEMSGRKGRMVMDVNTGDVSYQPRREDDVTLEQVNMVEKERFNTCQKLVAIISDAASTGISLHADKRYENSLQRVHITLELPWSADRAIQQFGRTHRSNQIYPPEYVFLISDLAGERRFASTVAKRLESLGALTHGDRRATETRDLSQFNIDNKFGRRALDSIFDTAFKNKSSLVPMPKGIDLQAAFDSVGLQPKDGKNVSKFLNRILGMRLEVQNALFQYYTDTMDELIKQAKRNQEFDRGIIDLAKEDDNIFVEETQVFRMTFLGDDIKVQLHRVKNITGMSWRSALEVPRGGNNSLDGFYITKNETQRKIVLAVQKKDRHGTWFNVFSPNIGEQSSLIENKTLNEGFKKASLEDAERMWNDMYSVTENRCLHYFWYKHCNYSKNCDTGCRSKIRYVLSGSIFYIWDIISAINKSPQLARVRLNDGSKIIGCIINPSHKERITEILANRESHPQQPNAVPTPGRVQTQLPKDRPMLQRSVRLVQQPKLSTPDQFYVGQNMKNMAQRPRMATIVSSPSLRYPPTPQRKMFSFSSGIIPPQQTSNIRLVPILNKSIMSSSVPNLRFTSHSSPIRLLQSPQLTQTLIHPSSSSSQLFNSAVRTTTKQAAVELPNSYIEFTE